MRPRCGGSATRWAVPTACALLVPACAYPTTSMVPTSEYAAGPKATVSSAPAYRAGPDYVRTTSPDGSTAFVCADGTTRSGASVPPSAAPPC